MFKPFSALGIMGLVADGTVILGVIYYIFWCLGHFGII